MSASNDETVLLRPDFTRAPRTTNTDTLEINEAIETAGAGLGTMLHVLGPFLLFCLEGGMTVVMTLVGGMVKCEWDLSAFLVTLLQVSY